MSCILLEEHPGTTIVTDSVTSTGLKWWIEQHLKGTHHRFQRGYRNVINEAIRLNKEGKASWLAMETSGHGALKENYWLDDGAYQIAKILIKMARLKEESGTTVDELIAELPEPAEALEFRPKILKKEFSAYADRILEAFRKFAENQPDWILTTPNYEGVHVTTPHGWILVRKSLHDPQIPINVESDLSGGATTLKKTLIRFLSSFDGLSL
jgi:phosphomannomutase